MNYSSSYLFAVKVADRKVLTLPKHNSLTNQLQGNIKNSSPLQHTSTVSSWGFLLPASQRVQSVLPVELMAAKAAMKRRSSVSQKGFQTICCFLLLFAPFQGSWLIKRAAKLKHLHIQINTNCYLGIFHALTHGRLYIRNNNNKNNNN